MERLFIAIRGAGEMASGVAHRLFSSGLTRIVMTEINAPISVRRRVSFCEAVYEKEMIVEGVRAELIKDPSEVQAVWGRNSLAVLVDREGSTLRDLKPDVLIDAIMSKKRNEPLKRMAPLVIGIGPGFLAPQEVDAVVESNRGHNLGRVIYEGEAEAYTGMPGNTEGYTKERVLRAPHAGTVRLVRNIGDRVRKGEIILYVDDTPVEARIDGILKRSHQTDCGPRQRKGGRRRSARQRGALRHDLGKSPSHRRRGTRGDHAPL